MTNKVALITGETGQDAAHLAELLLGEGYVVHDIKRRDVIELLEQIALDRPIMANRTHGVISKLFNWLCERDVIVASPCAGVKRPSEENARERVLTDPEIKRLWLACDAIGGPAGACIKTLLLTGQRRSGVAGMRRSEIINSSRSAGMTSCSSPACNPSFSYHRR